MTGNSNRQATGFTLVETLVTVTVFALTVVAAVDLYLVFFRSQRLVKKETEVRAEARHVTQSMIRALETSSIDYDYYGGTAPTTGTTLALSSPIGATTRFRQTGFQVEFCATRPPNDPCDDAKTDHWTVLNDQNAVLLSSLEFWLAPSTNPHQLDATGHALSNEQPRVTIVLGFTDAAGEHPVNVQTTFTSRIYAR